MELLQVSLNKDTSKYWAIIYIKGLQEEFIGLSNCLCAITNLHLTLLLWYLFIISDLGFNYQITTLKYPSISIKPCIRF